MLSAQLLDSRFNQVSNTDAEQNLSPVFAASSLKQQEDRSFCGPRTLMNRTTVMKMAKVFREWPPSNHFRKCILKASRASEPGAPSRCLSQTTERLAGRKGRLPSVAPPTVPSTLCHLLSQWQSENWLRKRKTLRWNVNRWFIPTTPRMYALAKKKNCNEGKLHCLMMISKQLTLWSPSLKTQADFHDPCHTTAIIVQSVGETCSNAPFYIRRNALDRD